MGPTVFLPYLRRLVKPFADDIAKTALSPEIGPGIN